MNFINIMQSSIEHFSIPILLIIGIAIFLGFYTGKITQKIKLPSIIGYMIIGVLLGPSLFGLISDDLSKSLGFITEISLGFVAVSIGLELSFKTLKEQGASIIYIIFSESFMAFIVVSGFVYLFAIVTSFPNEAALPLALLFGAIAPASAPAGTVAVIKEYKAKGPVTKALYSVVGFDDGLGIIIFGFASAVASSLLQLKSGNKINILKMIETPIIEITLSIVIGVICGYLISFLMQKLKNHKDYFILIFSFVFIIAGLSRFIHISLILTSMIMGIVIVNTQNSWTISKIGEELSNVMPTVFILFFILAGANLHVSTLPSLGLLGVIYIIGRTTGLMSGAYAGALIGGADQNIRNYLGLGILSQAGVAIGLALIAKQQFEGIGPNNIGDIIGNTLITTVTATSLFFEIIGPILTRIALKKSGEINV